MVWVPHVRKQESNENEYLSEWVFFNILKPVISVWFIIPVPFTGRIIKTKPNLALAT